MNSVSAVRSNSISHWISRMSLLVVITCLGGSARAHAQEPIKIGVIGEESSVAGASLTKAALLAADDINAKGGVNGRRIQVITYDDHSSAADAVRAFQRAVSDDEVVAVIGTYLSEVALAIEPWSARLRMPFITPGGHEHRSWTVRARCFGTPSLLSTKAS